VRTVERESSVGSDRIELIMRTVTLDDALTTLFDRRKTHAA
jgi:hypothetical protein